MRTVDLIRKKREGKSLAPAEIETLIADYVAGRVPDYQIAAWLMAVYLQGMISFPGFLILLPLLILSGFSFCLNSGRVKFHIPADSCD